MGSSKEASRHPITIRVSPAEHESMKAAARGIGLTLSAWLRMTAIRETKKGIGK
jgi:uncharacterized protein (DUF1778 family)